MLGGKLRKTVQLKSPTYTQDEFGQEQVTYPTIEATVRASIRHLGGRELWDARQVNAEASYRILMRWHSGVTPAWQIVDTDTSKVYHILSIADVHERGRWYEIIAKEQAA